MVNDQRYTVYPIYTISLLSSKYAIIWKWKPDVSITVPWTVFPIWARSIHPPPSYPYAGVNTSPSALQGSNLAPPAWASELIDDVRQIKSTLTKIDNIEKTVNSIVVKITDLETKVGGMETRLNDVEEACNFISGQNDSNTNGLSKAKSDIENLTKMCKTVENKAKSLQDEKIALESKVLDLECRSMRENLLFYGIAEKTGENCENLVKEFCADRLLIENVDQITIDRAHRVGFASTRGPRPIVVKFHSYKSREIVRNKSFETDISAELKRTEHGVGVQWPKQVRDARKELRPIWERENQKGNRVRYVRDKLYVNGRLVNPDTHSVGGNSGQDGMEV